MNKLERKYPSGIRYKPSIDFFHSSGKSVTFVPEENSNIQGFRLSNLSTRVFKFLCDLHNGLTWSSIETTFLPVVNLLDQRSVLASALPSVEALSRYEAQLSYLSEFFPDPISKLERIRSFEVIVIGCGGTGNVIVEQLLMAGFRRFILLDFDRVHISNLNRQMCFLGSDVGRLKTAALRDYILARNEEAIVVAVSLKITSEKDLASYVKISDPENYIAVCCADYPPIEIERIVASFSNQCNIPAVFGSVGIRTGILGPLLTDGGAKSEFLLDCERRIGQSKGREIKVTAASLSATNSLVGTIVSDNIIRYVCEFQSILLRNRRYVITFETMAVEMRYSYD